MHFDRDWKQPRNADSCELHIQFLILSEKLRVLHVCCQAIFSGYSMVEEKVDNSVSCTCIFCKSAFVCPRNILPMRIYSLIANCQAKTRPKLGTRGSQLKTIQWLDKNYLGVVTTKTKIVNSFEPRQCTTSL